MACDAFRHRVIEAMIEMSDCRQLFSVPILFDSLVVSYYNVYNLYCYDNMRQVAKISYMDNKSGEVNTIF